MLLPLSEAQCPRVTGESAVGAVSVASSETVAVTLEGAWHTLSAPWTLGLWRISLMQPGSGDQALPPVPSPPQPLPSFPFCLFCGDV